MRLGIGTYAFARTIAAGRMGADDLLRWASDHGAEAVQCCENLPWHSGLNAPNGLTVETGLRGIGDELLVHLAWAQEHGSGFVRLVIDRGDDEPSPQEAVERLRPYAARYRNADVTLAIENHDRYPAAILRGMVEELGCGVVLDTANSLGCLEGTETVVETLAPYVVNLHAKDVRAVRKPDMLGFDVVGAPLGEGGIDWAGVIKRLPRVVSVTLEQWVPDGPGALELEREWATRGLQELKEIAR
ncbi:TIM barrel protein [soil metagenome]